MTPNKVLFIFTIGSRSLTGELVPKDVELSSRFSLQRGKGYFVIAIGRLYLYGGK